MDNRDSLSGTKRSTGQRSQKSQFDNDSPKRNKESFFSDDGSDGLDCEDGPVICPYVKRIYNMMQSDHSDIVSWDDRGVTIIIKDKNQLEEIVLPKYFDSHKFASFKRQLHYYGFSKKTDDYAGYVLFSNPYFQRDKIELLHKIQRNANNQKLAPKDEGNAATLSEVQELKNRVLLLENQNTILHQTLCTLTERMNRIELSQSHGNNSGGGGSDWNNNNNQGGPPPLPPMDYQVSPSSPSPPPSMNDATPQNISSSNVAAKTSLSSRPPLLPSTKRHSKMTTTTTSKTTTTPCMPPLDTQLSHISTFSSTISMAGISSINVDEHILEKDDSFYSKANVAEPNIKRYSEYTTEELKTFTDSYRKMIEMMEVKKYSNRNFDSSFVGIDDSLANDEVFELVQSHGSLNNIPLRGQCTTLNIDEEEANEVLHSFTQSLTSSATTIHASNVPDGDPSNDPSNSETTGENKRDVLSQFRQFSI